MKRKLLLALLIVVLVLSLVMVAACKHEHNYIWGSDDTNHWKYCEKCEEIDESSKKPHDFTNGDCVCGRKHVHSYTQWYKDDPTNHWKVCPTDNVRDDTTVFPHDYGTTGVCDCGKSEPLVEYNVEGVVVLRKLGATTNSNDGVTLTLSDDEGELPTEVTKSADGKFTFKAYAGKYYITATKDGYIDEKLTVNITKDVGDMTGDDALELVMKYDAFYHGINDGTGEPKGHTGDYGHPENIDKSHVNDADPYFIVNNGADDFYQYSHDLYNDVAFGVTYKSSMGSDNLTISLVFEGKKAVMARVQKLNSSYKVQWVASGKIWMEDNIIGKWDIDGYTPISNELKTKYESDGIELKFVRRGGMVTLLVDGKVADTQNMPAEYADKQCRVAFIIPGVSGGKTEIHYNVSTNVENTPVTVTNPTVENGAIEVAGKNVGDHFVLTVKPDENCNPASLKVNGHERITDIHDGKLDLGVYTEADLTIEATFAKYVLVDVDVAISGKNLGKTVDLNGKTVTLTNILGESCDVTIANGKLTKEKLPNGKYTVTLDKYLPCEINISADGAVAEVVLAYNSLENMMFNQNWGNTVDLSQMNDGKFTTTNGNTVAVKSTEKFGNVQVTLNAHKGNGGKQGVWFLFPTDTGYDGVSVTIKDSGAIEFDKQTWWSESHITNVTASAKHKNGWHLADDNGNSIYQTLSADEMTLYEAGTFKLSVIRYGNYFYVYVNGEYTGNWCTVDEKYAETECFVGFVGTDTATSKDWMYEVNEVESLPALNIKLPETVANGSIALAAKSFKLGDQVTLNITLDENYVVDSLKVDGVEIKHRIKNDKVSFTPTSTDEIVVEIITIRVVYVNLDVAISGNKLGETVNLNGKTVTLTDMFGKEMQLTVADGKLTKTEFPVGTYTVTLEGYLPATLVVPEQGAAQAVVLAYELFEDMHFADWITAPDFAQMNNGKFTTGTSGNSVAVKSVDKFGNIQLTLNAHKGNGSRQGVWFLFPTVDGYNAVSITIQANGAIEFDKSNWWSEQSHITNKTVSAKHENGCWLANDEGEGIYRTLSADEMAMFEAGTLKLSVIRYGNYFYVYVNGEYTGNWCVVNEAYADVDCYIGFIGTDTPYGKEWNYSIKDDVTLPALNIKLPETVANGSVALAADSYKLGDQVTLNITLEENYVVDSLKVGGVEIKHRIKNDKVVFTPTSTDEVVVEITTIRVVYVNLDVAISGNNLGEIVVLNGQTVTLTDMFGKINMPLTVADGKLSKTDFPAGTYTVTLEGYLPATLVVPEQGAAQAVVLEYKSFEAMNFADWITAPDFAQMNNGKFTTGTNGNSVAVKSVDKFGNVQVTLNLHKGNGGKQGVWFLFPTDAGYDAVSITIKDSGAIEFDQSNWWFDQSHITNKTVSARHSNGWWLANDEGEGIYQTLSADEMAMFEAGTFKLSVIRYENYFYVYINDVYTGNWCTVDATKYAATECFVGFIGTDTPQGKEWNYSIKDNATLPALNVKLPETVANGSVELAAESYKLGDQVTLNLTVNDNCFVVALKVNGVDIKHRISDNKIVFTPTTVDVEVEYVIQQIKDVTISETLKARKYNKDIVLDRVNATLTNKADSTITYTLPIANGILTGDVKAGFYTLSVPGYLSTDVVIIEGGFTKEVVLQFDAFYAGGPKWGSYDFSKQNDGLITMTNGYAWVYTNEKFNNVAFSMYLKADGFTNGNQGIAFVFDGGDVAAIRQENRAKIQFAAGFGFNDKYNVNIAEGQAWIDLMFFGRYPELKQALNNGTLKLTVVREGNTIYAFINDVYFGKSVLAAKYADKECELGVYFEGAGDGSTKTIKYVMEDFETYRKAITVQKTAENGNITVSGENNKVGDELTILIAANAGYKVTNATVNGEDVTDKLVKGDNGFTLKTVAKTQSLDIVATFVATDNAKVDINVVGKKLESTAEIAVTATKATLKDLYNEYTLDIVDGKITSENIEAGVYTLSVDGFAPKTVVVDGTNGLTGTITLDVNIFTSAPASANLTQIGEGKIIATGNGGVDLTTTDKYVDVIAEATFDVQDYNGRRYGIALQFDDGKNFRVDFCVQDSGNNILQQTNWGSMMFNWEWVDFPQGYFAQNSNNYTRDEIEDEFMAKGLTYKLEREGATVKLYINNVLMKTYTLSDEYASKEAQVKFIFDSNGTDGTAEIMFKVTVPAKVTPEETPAA